VSGQLKPFLAAIIASAAVSSPFLIRETWFSPDHAHTPAVTVPMHAPVSQTRKNMAAQDNLNITETPDERQQTLWNTWYLIATFIGIVAAFFALLASYRNVVLSGRISTSQKVQIAEAGVKIAEANQKAKEAQLELARLINPRMISEEQQAQITEKAANFGGTKFDLAMVPNDIEAGELLQKIEAALIAGGWVEESWAPSNQLEVMIFDRSGMKLPNVGMLAATGVLFLIDDGQDRNLIQAATAVADGLRSAGIAARTGEMRLRGVSQHVVHVIVGKKPLPGQLASVP
jgi:hypothetical protein